MMKSQAVIFWAMAGILMLQQVSLAEEDLLAPRWRGNSSAQEQSQAGRLHSSEGNPLPGRKNSGGEPSATNRDLLKTLDHSSYVKDEERSNAWEQNSSELNSPGDNPAENNNYSPTEQDPSSPGRTHQPLLRRTTGKKSGAEQVPSLSEEQNFSSDEKIHSGDDPDRSSSSALQIPELVRSSGATGLNDKSVITLRPGDSQIIPVSLGYISRIVTPFDHPEVITSSFESQKEECGEFCIRGHAIYVNIQDNRPRSMFVVERDNPDLAFAVTMLPRRIPAREVTVRFADDVYQKNPPVVEQQISPEEIAGDYESALRDVLQTLALGEIPAGYTMRETVPGEYIPLCIQDGLHFTFTQPGQRFAGQRFVIYAGLVVNTSENILEAQESSCLGAGGVAAAYWPEVLLYPGKSSEIFVVEKVRHATDVKRRRPVLTGGRP